MTPQTSDDAPSITITGYNRLFCEVCADDMPFAVENGEVFCTGCGVTHLCLSKVDSDE